MSAGPTEAIPAVGRLPTQSVVAVDASSGTILFTSALAQDVVGRRLQDLAEVDAYAIYHPDGRRYAPSEWMLARSIASGEVIVDEEFFQVGPDGGRRRYRASSYPVYDADGRLTAAVAVTRDVTAEEHVETELAYHASLLDNLDDAVVGTDAEFRVTVWNRGAEGLYGYAADEVLGRPARDVATYVGDRSPVHLERELHRTGRARAEMTAYRRDGTPVEVELSVVAVRNAEGKVTGYLGVHRDVTERKRIADERAARAHRQGLVAALGLRALAAGELQPVLDEAVAAVAEGTHVPLVAIAEVRPDDEALVLRAGVGWDEGAVGVGRGGAGRRSLVGYTVMTGGPVVSADVEADPRFEVSPFLRAYAPASAAVVVISGRREPFGALAAFSRTSRSFSDDDVNFLQAVANVVAAAVERAATEDLLVEVRDAERRRLARDLHDEALQNLTDALAQAVTGVSGDGEEAAERLAQLVPALTQAGKQIRAAIYDLARGAEEARPIGELLEEMVAVHRELADGMRIELDVHPGVSRSPIGSAGTQLLRGIGEALVNARRHSGAARVTVTVWPRADELCVDVTDDGHGFDAGAEPAPGSSGLKGMRERAELVDGEFAIRSTPDGTTVHFTVPVGEGSVPARKVRVLLVEDHAAVRDAIAAVFEGAAGFDVVGQAGSLAEARSMLEDVDVAVVDLALPDGFGGDLIRELRRVSPGAQALVLSAGLERSETARAIASGAAGALDKTARLDEVVDAVRRLRAGETLLPREEIVELLRFAAHERDRERIDRHAIDALTPRERQVLQLLAEGLGGQAIAERLHITPRTARNHIASILAKLDVHSQLQAVLFALRYGIVEVR